MNWRHQINRTIYPLSISAPQIIPPCGLEVSSCTSIFYRLLRKLAFTGTGASNRGSINLRFLKDYVDRGSGRSCCVPAKCDLMPGHAVRRRRLVQTLPGTRGFHAVRMAAGIQTMMSALSMSPTPSPSPSISPRSHHRTSLPRTPLVRASILLRQPGPDHLWNLLSRFHASNGWC